MKPIRYYSTNRNLALEGLEPFKGLVSFREALIMGQAPDGGLFMPEGFPELSPELIGGLKGKPYWEAALMVGEKFWGDEISRDELEAIVKDAYDYEIPIEEVYPPSQKATSLSVDECVEGNRRSSVKNEGGYASAGSAKECGGATGFPVGLHGRKYVMRLDRGPTASFKDFAARLMSRLMSRLRDPHKHLNVLVATSGDTGSAIGEAFKGVEGIDVYILYPEKEVSPRQKKQLDTIGGNVSTLMVEGKFDDCQNMVKRAFLDPDLAKLNLTSANSINIGRVLPQCIYYIWGYAQVAEEGEEAVICVPSGNFGNACGCEFAWRMGLPLHRLLMPTNENDEFPNFLETGEYGKVSPSRKCLSNAMNVGHPSNLARFFDVYGGNVDKEGTVHRLPDVDLMRKRIFSISVSDRETRETIKEAYEEYGLLLEPHGAVGWRGLAEYLKREGDFPLCISIETAHPAKFPDEIEELLAVHPDVPESLRDIDQRTGEPTPIPNDYREFKDFLERIVQTSD